MQRILPTARVGAAILLRVSPRAANRTVNSPYCDPDGNAQIDQDDVNLISAARDTPASGPGDPFDADGDGTITVLDSAVRAERCRWPSCKRKQPQPPGSRCDLLGIEVLLALTPLA